MNDNAQDTSEEMDEKATFEDIAGSFDQLDDNDAGFINRLIELTDITITEDTAESVLGLTVAVTVGEMRDMLSMAYMTGAIVAEMQGEDMMSMLQGMMSEAGGEGMDIQGFDLGLEGDGIGGITNVSADIVTGGDGEGQSPESGEGLLIDEKPVV